MYVMRARNPEGLGLPWFIPVIAAIGASTGSALAHRLISGPSSPSQKDIEKQLKLEQQLEIERQMQAAAIQQQQTEQLGKLLMPALGLVALVMLLR